MTSVERESGNIYGGAREPKYSAVSYTWRRWQVPPSPTASPPISIQGITWVVPSVDPGYFSAKDLSRMISQTRTATGNRFIWLEVACIDQEDRSPQVWDEFSNRPGIFANASVAFVWLCSIPKDALQKSWICWEKLLRHRYSDWNMFQDLEGISALENALCTFLTDPWFKSLWELQAGSLRNDALLLSREAEFAEADMIPCNVHSIILGFSIIYSTYSNSSAMPRSPDKAVEVIADRIKLHIDNSGIPLLGSNPNLTYIVANRRPNPRHQDLFYAMAGLYDIELGTAKGGGAFQDDEVEISELQEEFAFALNKKSFFQGQLFVHVETPASGKSWQITPTARVPRGFDQWTPRHVTDNCVLDGHPGATAHVSANMSSFECLVKFWKVRLKDLPDAERNDQLLVVVDDYLRQPQSAVPTRGSQDLASGTVSSNFLHTQATINWLLSSFESCRISILMLGGQSFRDGLFEEYFGLLILHDEKERCRCQRIGLCKWEGNDYFGNIGVSEEAKAAMPLFKQRYNGVMY